ncbi:PepSY-associated TM helix domain-containing protein [Acidovorax sacchari]|uniref:PepSY-associated TM helix domain-containing protein n=1 Tax=Acidovorax sacchari TaxID=3230736 RepID=UPI0039E45189
MAPMTSTALQRWAWVHKVSSLACTVAMLLVCITGFPLVFSDEIDDWLHPVPQEAAGQGLADIDAIVADALRRHPGEWPEYVVRDGEAPVVLIGMKPSPQAPAGSVHKLRYDAHTGEPIGQENAAGESALGIGMFMQATRRLHTDLFAGLAGGIFMGAMALLFILANVSGLLLYAPFMKNRRFGTVRRERSQRIVWLDLHNLLGIALLAWALLVGVTGAFNQFAKPLFAEWTATQVRPLALQMGAHAQGGPPPPGQWTSLGAAIRIAEQALPGTRVGTMLMPGSQYGSAQHYLLWAAGDTPLTSRMLQPVLVDASTGQFSAIVRMPWYLRALELSRPLHFGDYGGLPLKLLWELLDGITIIVLASGLWLWRDRRRRKLART